uniref:Uncharacterized protein n=1 Tax=Tanacetum cinerariifolium TaxID=118510 RepID=A0A699WMY5_TANCI|nr:hypothetical protein [Tanacetum cinerariifolium]
MRLEQEKLNKTLTTLRMRLKLKREHYRRDCPKRKNQNHENQIKSTQAHGMVHAFGAGETEQDLNNIEDEIKA